MTLSEVVALNEMSMSLRLNKQIRRNYIGVTLPMVGEENIYVESLQAFVHASEGIVAPVSALPVDKLTRCSTKGFPKPTFSFF